MTAASAQGVASGDDTFKRFPQLLVPSPVTGLVLLSVLAQIGAGFSDCAGVREGTFQKGALPSTGSPSCIASSERSRRTIQESPSASDRRGQLCSAGRATRCSTSVRSAGSMAPKPSRVPRDAGPGNRKVWIRAWQDPQPAYTPCSCRQYVIHLRRSTPPR